jgi:hypothetical protein
MLVCPEATKYSKATTARRAPLGSFTIPSHLR